jgi:AraC-like DNA-binding protein
MAGMLHDNRTIHPHGMRILGRYALILVLDGKAFYKDSTGQRFNLDPGDAVIVTPELAHAYGSRNDHAWGQIYVVFDGPQFDMLQQSSSFRAHQPVWHLGPFAYWQRQLEELLNSPRTGHAMSSLQAVSRFAQLLVEVASVDAEGKDDQKNDWFEESLRILGEPEEDRWVSPQQAAKRLGISYESFRKSFSTRTGQPPGKFQQQRRIDLACASIYRGRENFKEMAERLGFCDVYHFSKVFRKVAGMPPSAYRRTVRGS